MTIPDRAFVARPSPLVGWARFVHDTRVRDVALQGLALAVVAGAVAFFVSNAAEALRARGIASGFGYLSQEAGFGIGESLFVTFEPSNSYLRAFVVGLVNTLRVSLLAIVAATVLGFVLGIMRLSRNLGAAKLSAAYVELFRNTPQLLQIVFWYAVMTRLPGPRQAIAAGGDVYVSNRGIVFPWPAADAAYAWMGAAFLLGVAAVYFLRRWASARQARSGTAPSIGIASATLLVALPFFVWMLAGAPAALDRPMLRGLNFVGGATLSPEFVALFLGLALYTAAFIAEIVRSGIEAVDRGQVDAARSLGLRQGQVYRLVVIPQALRVMIPPAAGQYVSLVKSSSLAVAIGYPDLVNVSNTTLNQTGHVVEALVAMSLVYLVVSFSISAAMNLYNRLVAIKER